MVIKGSEKDRRTFGKGRAFMKWASPLSSPPAAPPPPVNTLAFQDGKEILSHGRLFSIPIVLFVPVEGLDLRHLLIAQRKMIQLRIFLDVVRIAGTGNDHHALLQVPP